MNNSPSVFIDFNVSKLGYSSKQDLIENLFIKSLVESYTRLNKNIGIENEIRDRFRDDLYSNPSSLLKKWLDFDIIYLDWENWHFASDKSLGRTDFAFKISGLKFIVECKRLKSADNAYIKEGLERFISLKYGKDDTFGGMIGFVISGNKLNIATELNNKISNLSHTNTINTVSSIPSFESNHTKDNNGQIDIYHLFFDFSLS